MGSQRVRKYSGIPLKEIASVLGRSVTWVSKSLGPAPVQLETVLLHIAELPEDQQAALFVRIRKRFRKSD